MNMILVMSSTLRGEEDIKDDYSDCFSVHLIGSIPGRHTGPDINKFGHLKLRQVIDCD